LPDPPPFVTNPKGWQVKFQTKTLHFCDRCKGLGVEVAKLGWPEDKPFPSKRSEARTWVD
jgi:hypothetical protein